MKKSLDSIGTVHMDTAVGPNFELSGRRTFGASFNLKPSTPLPVVSNLNTSSDRAGPDDVALNYNAIPGHSAALVNDYTPTEAHSSTRRKNNPNPVHPKAEDAQHFLKISWPKISRQKEPAILRIASDRVKNHLPLEHPEAVMGHLPSIVQFREVEGTSTATIRQLLGLSH